MKWSHYVVTGAPSAPGEIFPDQEAAERRAEQLSTTQTKWLSGRRLFNLAQQAVKRAAEQETVSCVKRWLEADEKGVFEQTAAKLIAVIPLCYRDTEIIRQVAAILRLNALEAMIRHQRKRLR